MRNLESSFGKSSFKLAKFAAKPHVEKHSCSIRSRQAWSERLLRHSAEKGALKIDEKNRCG